MARGDEAGGRERCGSRSRDVAAAGDPDARSVHRDAGHHARDGHAQGRQLRAQVERASSKGSRFRRMCSAPAS